KCLRAFLRRSAHELSGRLGRKQTCGPPLERVFVAPPLQPGGACSEFWVRGFSTRTCFPAHASIASCLIISSSSGNLVDRSSPLYSIRIAKADAPPFDSSCRAFSVRGCAFGFLHRLRLRDLLISFFCRECFR